MCNTRLKEYLSSAFYEWLTIQKLVLIWGEKTVPILNMTSFCQVLGLKVQFFFLNGFSAREQICSICIPSGTHSHRFLCMLSENKSGKNPKVLSLQKREKFLLNFHKIFVPQVFYNLAYNFNLESLSSNLNHKQSKTQTIQSCS